MFEKLSTSWELVKASAAVLRADKELLLFPVISAVLSMLVVVTFVVPAMLAGVFGLISLATLAVGVLLIVAAAATESAVLTIFVVACLVLAFVAIALVSSALSGVYAAAVYRYAADGQADGFFTPAMVRSAFRAK